MAFVQAAPISERGADELRVIGQIAGATPMPQDLPPTPSIIDATTAEDVLHDRGGRRTPGPAPKKITNLDLDPDADT